MTTKRGQKVDGTPDGAAGADAAIPADETFESRLKALEQVVARLESDEVPLEEAITLYEKGMALHQACEKILVGAQLRIEQLGKPAGTAAQPQGSNDAD